MVLVEGLTLTGDLLNTFKNKGVVVLNHYYEEKEFDGKKKKKLYLEVSSNENKGIYKYPINNTSIMTLVKRYGAEMDDWTSKVISLEVKEQSVSGTDKLVIYVIK